MNYVNFTSKCRLLKGEKGNKTFETSGRVITFETKLYRVYAYKSAGAFSLSLQSTKT